MKARRERREKGKGKDNTKRRYAITMSKETAEEVSIVRSRMDGTTSKDGDYNMTEKETTK